jgi:MFS family permease
MAGFVELLRENRNYRNAWLGQVVSEIGDHFNNVAVFGLAMETMGSGLVVSGVMLSRAIPAVMAGPLAGVVLDRLDRKKVMIASDLVRAVMALAFVLTVYYHRAWLLYLLSALLMFASPFFTSGRAAILPSIASKEELHTANTLTQTTQWTTLTVGAMLGGFGAAHFGYAGAFVLNSVSFLFSAWAISRLKVPGGGFQAERRTLAEDQVVRPWHEYKQGLLYMKSTPLILAIALVGVGWATGGGAAQILFPLFGEQVFGRGPAGIGTIWGFAGLGLLVGGVFSHWLGKRTGFRGYRRAIALCYLVHGGAYVLFSQAQHYGAALFFIALSRAGVGVSSVLNFSQLLRHVPDRFRGRVFSTNESMVWSVMMLSMAAAGIASTRYDPRAIGLVSGLLSSTTALFWLWAGWRGMLEEPPEAGVEPREVEIHGEPRHRG